MTAVPTLLLPLLLLPLQLNTDMANKCLNELAATGRGFTAQAQASPYFLAIPERSAAIYGYGWQFQASIGAQMLLAAELAASNDTEAALWRDMAAMQVRRGCWVGPGWADFQPHRHRLCAHLCFCLVSLLDLDLHGISGRLAWPLQGVQMYSRPIIHSVLHH